MAKRLLLVIEQILEAQLLEVEDVEGLSSLLKKFLESGCYVWTEKNGDEILLQGRAEVGRIGNLKISIYADEHPPPHFHVRATDFNATFAIDDCRLLTGNIDRKNRKLIEVWHQRARHKIIEFWNHSRPADCPVGPILEDEGK